MANRARGRQGGRVSALASLAVHVVALALAWFTGVARVEPVAFLTYDIELVALPAPEEAEEPQASAPDELVVEDPRPTQPETDPLPPPPEPEADEPEPLPDPAEPPPEEPLPSPPDATSEPPPDTAEETARSPEPDPEAEGGEAINVRLEGLRRDYPAYYENIIRQINRCMRWRGQGTPETIVYFVIERDGTLTDLRPLEPSGNIAFDAGALGAVECAGPRFGPLPEGLPYDRLPVRFTISARPGGEGAAATLRTR